MMKTIQTIGIAIGVAILKKLWTTIKSVFLITMWLISIIWQSMTVVKQGVDGLNKKLDDIDKRLDAKSKDRNKSNR